MNIFCISDTHWFHENIKKYENRPNDFNEIIIANWNKVVRPQDLVIHLGDVIFGLNKDENLPTLMSRLMGTKILCMGNHDYQLWDWYLERGFSMVGDYFIYRSMAFSHAPITPLPPMALKNHSKQVELNIHGHFHRGRHRVPQVPGQPFADAYYDYDYYVNHKNNYELIQIEDELRPFSLEEVLSRHAKTVNQATKNTA